MVRENRTFSQLFFSIYDRKISAGEISFRELGMPKSDFTRLCTRPSYVPDGELIEKLCRTMKLTEEEQKAFRRFIREEEK